MSNVVVIGAGLSGLSAALGEGGMDFRGKKAIAVTLANHTCGKQQARRISTV